MSIEQDIEEIEKMTKIDNFDPDIIECAIQKCTKKLETMSLRNKCSSSNFIEIQKKIADMKTPNDISIVLNIIDSIVVTSLSDDIDLSIVYSDFLAKAQKIKSNIEYLS